MGDPYNKDMEPGEARRIQKGRMSLMKICREQIEKLRALISTMSDTEYTDRELAEIIESCVKMTTGKEKMKEHAEAAPAAL